MQIGWFSTPLTGSHHSVSPLPCQGEHPHSYQCFDIDTDCLRILEETDLLDDKDNMDIHEEETLYSFDED